MSSPPLSLRTRFDRLLRAAMTVEGLVDDSPTPGLESALEQLRAELRAMHEVLRDA